MPFGSPGAYPVPGASTAYGTGPQWLKMHQFQPQYQAVTDSHEYEDGGASFVTFNDVAPILWVIEYNGLSEAQSAVIDGHRADAFGAAYEFTFFNPRNSTTYQRIHYVVDFQEDHRKTWNNSRIVKLIQLPA